MSAITESGPSISVARLKGVGLSIPPLSRKTGESQEILSYATDRLSCRVFPMDHVKDDPKPRPHAEKGRKLRTRRKELKDSGVLQLTVAKIAEAVGISPSAYNQYELGYIWPKGETKKKLAAIMKWTEPELEYGKPSGGANVYSPSQHELHLLLLYGRLSPERQRQVFDSLTAETATENALQVELRGPLRPVSDQKVAQHLPKPLKTVKRR